MALEGASTARTASARPAARPRFAPRSSVVDGPTAALVMEPIQGKGGGVVFPTAFVLEARRIADEFGALLIFDEIQTLFGRTGQMFAAE